MRRVKKPVFFIVLLCIISLGILTTVGIHTTYGDVKTTIIKGVGDIRWGIDIRGGVDVTFCTADGVDASVDDLNKAKDVIEQRLIKLNITDKELYVDENNDRIVLRFPWKADEANFDAEAAADEIGETALLTFREDKLVDDNGLPTGVTKDNVILEGADVKKAQANIDEESNYIVSLELNDAGKQKFSDATAKLYPTKGIISIWMDDDMISYPNVQSHISDGRAQISGNFSKDEAINLAGKINSGSMPIKLERESLNIISPTQGMGARDAMVLGGLIAFILVAIYITVTYKLPGFVASIALIGQVVGSLMAITGFVAEIPSFTLTLPGLAGIILSVGMGVDANVITSERIKEELAKGKSLNGSIEIGFNKGWTAILDGNLTVILVAIVLMGAFGSPDSIISKLLTPFFFMFGPSTAGAIYSFGFTLTVGVICNFIFGVFSSRLMLSSLSKYKRFQNKKLYGGVSNEENL